MSRNSIEEIRDTVIALGLAFKDSLDIREKFGIKGIVC